MGCVEPGQAIDRLIEANRDAPARPVPGEGQVLVDRSYAVWLSSTVSGDTPTNALELTFYERLTHPDGNTKIVRAPLATTELPATAEELRRFAGRYLPVTNVARLRDAGDLGAGAGASVVEEALAEAERESHGSSSTRARRHRASRAGARVHPSSRRAAGGPRTRPAHPGTGDHRPLRPVPGRVLRVRPRSPWTPRCGHRRLDPNVGEWSVLIFDRDTGDLLGELDELPSTAGLDVTGVVSYTSNETFVEDAS